LVMCPDLETYALLIVAGFDGVVYGADPGHRLRVRLADRSLVQTNALLGAASRLLALADWSGRPQVKCSPRARRCDDVRLLDVIDRRVVPIRPCVLRQMRQLKCANHKR
jgi:hypothetical protein